MKLYHKRKRKKIFKFKILTTKNLNHLFYFNLFHLRIPDTYTRRGILNNLFPLNVRKKKTATHR